MNIFVISDNPIECAQTLDDKRVVKMILESTQMLSTAVSALGGNAPYKPTHAKHPCTLWVQQDPRNAGWLWQHALALFGEYELRYGKDHKCFGPFMQCAFELMRLGHMDFAQPDSFVNCTTHHKYIDDVHMAYQLEMCHKWDHDKREPRWYGVAK